MKSPPVLPVPPVPLRPVVKKTLDALSIDDVREKLKELQLNKYAKKFHKSYVDGVILQKLTEDTLKTEFGMSHLEFIRLNAFVTDLHIPQHSTTKKSTGTLPRLFHR